MDHIPKKTNLICFIYAHIQFHRPADVVFYWFCEGKQRREEKNLNENYVLYSINWNEILR